MQSAFVDGWEMDPLHKKAAVSITDGHKAEFAWERAAEIVVKDNGPSFACQKCTASAGFNHIMPSQHLPQSNGEAEAAVKIAKKIYWKGKRKR